MNMTKQDIITAVAEATGQSEYTTRIIVEATLETLTKALRNQEDVVFRGFGTFKITERSARKARNINTGETIYVGARKAVTFEPGKELKKI